VCSSDLREVEHVQRRLNEFTDRFVYHVTPLRVDGVWGQHSRQRLRRVKHWLGLAGRHSGLRFSDHFEHRLLHPLWDGRHPGEVIRGRKRRRAHRRAVKRNEARAVKTTGVGTLDGKPVANWIIPYVIWARTHEVNGRRWQGVVASGWRDPEYSEHLCFQMCGAPKCAGRCAGRSSGHSQSVKPAGCIDVTDYEHFGQAMRACPYTPRLINDLPIDRVHYSVTGH